MYSVTLSHLQITIQVQQKNACCSKHYISGLLHHIHHHLWHPQPWLAADDEGYAPCDGIVLRCWRLHLPSSCVLLFLPGASRCQEKYPCTSCSWVQQVLVHPHWTHKLLGQHFLWHISTPKMKFLDKVPKWLSWGTHSCFDCLRGSFSSGDTCLTALSDTCLTGSIFSATSLDRVVWEGWSWWLPGCSPLASAFCCLPLLDTVDVVDWHQ